jgi:type IV fimbrial biogenesis protein FimT
VAAIAAPRAQRPHGPNNRHGAPTPITVRAAKRTPPHGFTLIELLVVMAIIAIFASFAIPSFRGLIASASVSSAVNAFISDTRYARGEAMRRGKTVMICRSANPMAGFPVCSSGDGQAVGSWMEGWFVFVDDKRQLIRHKRNRASYPAALAGLSNFLAVLNSASLTPVNNRNYIAYDATGRAVGLTSRWLVHPLGHIEYRPQLHTHPVHELCRPCQHPDGEVICR